MLDIILDNVMCSVSKYCTYECAPSPDSTSKREVHVAMKHDPWVGATLTNKPKSSYTSCFVQTSYVKHSFYLGFNRGVLMEWLWKNSGHIYLDDEKTLSQRGRND